MFDLANLDVAAFSEAGYELTLMNPFEPEKELDMSITIRGDKSRTVEAYNRKKFNEYQTKERVAKGKQKDVEYKAEDLEEMGVEQFAVRVMSWKNFKLNGQDLECNPDNVRMIGKAYPWIREQVIKAAGDLDNFRPK